MPKAVRLPSGAWRVRVYDGKDENGKRICHSITADTKKQAELEAALFDYKKKQPAAEATLGQAIDRYIDAKSKILSPSTKRGYKSLRNNAYADIIDAPLSSLTKERQQRAINIYAGGTSPKTVRNASGLLYATLSMFAPDHACRLTLPQPRKQRTLIPTKAQVARLIDHVTGTWMLLAILLAAALGLRRSEISALKHDDFDIKAGTVHIQNAMVRSDENLWVLKPTKTTESDRVLKVPAFILDMVKAIPDDGGHIIKKRPDSISAAFRRVLNRLDLHFRFHDLRHYYASILLALGIPDKYAAKRMGHATTNMLKKVYQHIMEDKDKEIDQSIDTQITNLFT